MNILLTGATGYLGSHLLKKLVKTGHEVTVLKRSFSNTFRIDNELPVCQTYDLDRVDVSEIFTKHQFDLIVHCATNYGRKETDPLQTVEANLLLPLRLLELGRKFGVRAFINTDTILDKGVNTYSLSKSQFKDWLKEYSSSLVCCNVALEHFYGAGDDKTKFVSSIIDAFLCKKPALELTPGLQKRDFIFIEDVVDAILAIIDACLELALGFHPFEIGTGNPLTIRHFVELVKELSGNTITNLLFGALPYRANEVMSCETEIGAISRLGWTARHTLIQGLKETIQEEKRVRGL